MRPHRQDFAVARDVTHSIRRKTDQSEGQRHDELGVAAGYGQRKQRAGGIVALRVLAADVNPLAVGEPAFHGHTLRVMSELRRSGRGKVTNEGLRLAIDEGRIGDSGAVRRPKDVVGVFERNLDGSVSVVFDAVRLGDEQ